MSGLLKMWASVLRNTIKAKFVQQRPLLLISLFIQNPSQLFHKHEHKKARLSARVTPSAI